MRCKPWNNLILLSPALLGGVGALAQYNLPATPAPYNPIALAEVTGAARTAVQAGQSNYKTLAQNPYLGGVPRGKLSATAVALSLEDAVALGLKQNLGGVLATNAISDARGQCWQALSERSVGTIDTRSGRDSSVLDYGAHHRINSQSSQIPDVRL